MWKLIISVIGATLAACIALPATAEAASEYDDLVDKITTKTMINHVQDYYGKSCGSPTDDYAYKWLYAFNQKHYFMGPYDDRQHAEAVRSLQKAMTSKDGAYAVVYIQNSGSGSNSTPSIANIYWTESDKNSFITMFLGNKRDRYLYIARRKNESSARLRSVTIGDPSRGEYCQQEFMNISLSTTASFFIDENSHPKLLVSTFDVMYPNDYTGRPIPNKDSAISWQPTGTRYDKTIQKITTKYLSGYGSDEYGNTCNSPADDYTDRWLHAFENYPTENIINHQKYVNSLRRAISSGAYAITYKPGIIHKTNGLNWQYPAINILWTENKNDYEMLFSGEEKYRAFVVRRRRYEKDAAPLYRATLAPPRLLHINDSCDMQVVSVSDEYNLSDLYLPEWSYMYKKLFKNTFTVRYPIGYKGLQAPGNPTKLDYLALGDSFSSGEGDTDKNPATDRKYYRQWTDVNEDKAKGAPREKCHVSTRSYPYKLANWMGLGSGPSAAWASVACSGATVYDMNWDNSGGYEGQGSPLGRLHGYDNKGVLQKMALNEMIPGRVKQIEFVKKYQPKVITLTAGGNDVGFSKKIKDCVNPFASSETCDWANSEMGTLGSQIRGQFDRLVSLYKELKSASPGVKIYAIGYPQFITDKEPANCGLNAGNANVMERRMIVRATQYMNEVIEAAARKAGVKYVDISQALNGGKMCEKHQIYMTGIVGLGEQESYHPNKFGHTMIFVEIAKQLNHESLLTYSKYPSAGDESVNAPSSIYFDKGAPSSANTTMLANSKPSKGSKQKVVLAKNSLQPGSSARVEIRSKPADLGSYTVLNDGSIKETITIPENIPAGYHTLFIYGKSASGEDIKITQTLLVTGKDKEDLDDDGVKDTNQPCGAFLKASGKDEDLDGIDDACDPEITDPILYTARNGKSEFNEDEGKIYVFRNTRAAKLTGVNNDYIDRSSNKDNTEALIASSLTEDTKNLFFSRLVIAKEDDKGNNISKGMPIVLVKDINEKCYALKPEDYLSPVLRPGSNGYKPRGLIKLNRLPKGVSCEE